MPRTTAFSLAVLLCLCCAPSRAAELVVAAALSLSDAFRELGKNFEASRGNAKVIFSFGPSDVLLAQASKGAPIDVFASADIETMDKAQSRGLLIENTRRIYLGNRLVLIVPEGVTSGIRALRDLQSVSVRRIAIGNPATVPAGRYAKDAIGKAGILPSIESKLIHAQHARQALDYVSRQEVDAGFVYATDAALLRNKVRVIADMPTSAPIVYPIAVLKETRNRTLADAFIAAVAADHSTPIFLKFGFSRP